jgi:hypothetical protein
MPRVAVQRTELAKSGVLLSGERTDNSEIYCVVIARKNIVHSVLMHRVLLLLSLALLACTPRAIQTSGKRLDASENPYQIVATRAMAFR